MTRHSPAGGSALMIVLWAIAVMSVAVLGIVEYVNYDQDETIAQTKGARAYQLAESGLAIGLHPQVKRGDAVLMQSFGPDEKFEVHVRSEGGRLNINTILITSQWDTLADLFVRWGMDEADAITVAQSFRDWALPKLGQSKGTQLSFASTAGSAYTSSTQPAAPAQSGSAAAVPVRLFQSVDEMLMVPGMDLVVGAKPDWTKYFTIWSDGTLDINEAPADLIAAVCGVGGVQAEHIVNMRMGPDGKPDTDDDFVFQTMEQVRQALGMSPIQFQQIQGRINLQDSATRVESIGTMGNIQRTILAVARRNSTPLTFLQWQEY